MFNVNFLIMATKTQTKQNRTAQNGATKTEVKKALTKEATVQPKTNAKASVEASDVKPIVNLDERINRFEKLRGLASKREQLVSTLGQLTKFNYNAGDSSFHLKDANGMSFATGNTNLIKLVTEQLQSTLEARKNELEAEIIAFEL